MKYLIAVLLLLHGAAKAQKIESIHVNLYTDSLKKGTFNYINIDGKKSNGQYVPLDSTELIFTASAGKFYGNSLWVDPAFTGEKISISVTGKNNTALHKEFDMYIKKLPDNERLRTVDEILNGNQPARKKKRNS